MMGCLSYNKVKNILVKWLLQIMQYITTTTTTTILRLSGLSGITRVSRYKKTYSPTHTYHGHKSSLICFLIFYYPWHPPCSIYMPDSLSRQSFSKFSLVYLSAWHPPLHTPYISSLSHCLLFARNLFCCNTEICHPSLSLNLYLELRLVAECHTSI